MSRPRHTDEERKSIIERVRTSGRPLAEIAAEEGVSRQTVQRSSFIELPAPRTTVVELCFPDGTLLRIQG